jgi:hypothetical protein
MSTWNELIQQLNRTQIPQRDAWFDARFNNALSEVARLRGTNVLVYFSAFLQKEGTPINCSLSHDDMNGFMSGLCGLDWNKPLTLILHTPGGVPTAAQSIMDYLRSKFSKIEIIVPLMAMSAGTMMCLASDHIIMGNHSQLGPIDPQMPVNGRYVSAGAILKQFDQARSDIMQDKGAAAAWFPILNFLGPSLCVEASQAIEFGRVLVANWLERYMYANHADPHGRADATAEYFSRNDLHLNHGRRIGKEEARSQELSIEDLENQHDLQEAVLTAYHLGTILCGHTTAVKIIRSNTGNVWIKNVGMPQMPPQQRQPRS